MRTVMALWILALAACSASDPRFHEASHSPDHCPLCHLYASAKYGVVQIESPDGSGSGCIIDDKGLILTNRHVVGDRQKVTVTLFDGRKFDGRIIRRGQGVDLALVELENPPSDLKPLSWDLTSRVEEGEEIIVIGHPLNLRWTITRGIVSRIRDLNDPSAPNTLQIDAPISPGNSGGPVLSMKGKMIGIVTFKVIARGAENLGFACPMEKAADFLK